MASQGIFIDQEQAGSLLMSSETRAYEYLGRKSIVSISQGYVGNLGGNTFIGWFIPSRGDFFGDISQADYLQAINNFDDAVHYTFKLKYNITSSGVEPPLLFIKPSSSLDYCSVFSVEKTSSTNWQATVSYRTLMKSNGTFTVNPTAYAFGQITNPPAGGDGIQVFKTDGSLAFSYSNKQEKKFLIIDQQARSVDLTTKFPLTPGGSGGLQGPLATNVIALPSTRPSNYAFMYSSTRMLQTVFLDSFRLGMYIQVARVESTVLRKIWGLILGAPLPPGNDPDKFFLFNGAPQNATIIINAAGL